MIDIYRNMRISWLNIRNFRAFADPQRIALSDMTVIVGPNDVGKSCIVYALALFFGRYKLTTTDFNTSKSGEPIEVEVCFTDIEEETKDELNKSGLLDSQGNLVIKKTYDKDTLKPKSSILVYDYDDPDFRGLKTKKEKDLNDLGRKYNLSFTKSGRSITNESKIEELAKYAEAKSIPKKDNWRDLTHDEETLIEKLLPAYIHFQAEQNINTEGSEFQTPFQDAISSSIDVDNTIKTQVEQKVGQAITEIVKGIEANLKTQTDTISELGYTPNYNWKKLVNITLTIKDNFGVEVPLDHRGMGIRRLTMVAYLKYRAEQTTKQNENQIYAIEEPEIYLHPKAQRDLIQSLSKLKESGNQIILTSHSPVFVSEVGKDEIVLVTRQNGATKVTQQGGVDPEKVAEELGILPRDDLAGYSACLFVEGPADAYFYKQIAEKLYKSGKIPKNLDDAEIGVIPVGGDNLKFFVEQRLLVKLNRKYAVIVDSDKKSLDQQVSDKKHRWKQECERQGGKFYILRKRAIENYLHPDAIKRALNKQVNVEDYNDVKKDISCNYDWEKHLKPVIQVMTPEEILERDKYVEGGIEKHELLEILKEVISLAN